MAVIAIDLDGTLLRRDKTISRRTREVLRAASERGHVPVFATARPPSATLQVLPEELHDGWIVCYNGARVIHRGKLVEERLMPGGALREIASLLGIVAPGVAWGYVEGDDLWVRGSFEHHFGPEYYRAMATGVPTFPDSPKVLVDVPHEFPLGAFVATLPRACQFVLTDRGTLCQLMAAGVDKASGVSLVLERLQTDFASTVCFGDDHNDVPLFRRAAMAVAMANAVDAVKAAAHEVTASNDDDGVARWIEERLLCETSLAARWSGFSDPAVAAPVPQV